MAGKYPTDTNSRSVILRLLCTTSHTTQELASAMGISANAVRKALAQLEADGLVRYRRVARGVGKPPHEYEITPEGEGAISLAYLPLLQALSAELAGTLSARRMEALWRNAGRRMVRSPATGPVRKRLQSAVRALNALGGDATASATGIECRCCAISGIVVDQPLACSAMEEFVSALTGVAVRERCDRNGRPHCRFELEAETVARQARRHA